MALVRIFDREMKALQSVIHHEGISSGVFQGENKTLQTVVRFEMIFP
jgi:hypothetical protein